MTFPRVDAGAAARPASVGWFGVVAQSDPFLEALSAGATARSPFLPVGVAPVDCWRKTDDGHLESRPLKMREKILPELQRRTGQKVQKSGAGIIPTNFQT